MVQGFTTPGELVVRVALPVAMPVIRAQMLLPMALVVAVEAAVVRTSLLAVLVELAALVALASS